MYAYQICVSKCVCTKLASYYTQKNKCISLALLIRAWKDSQHACMASIFFLISGNYNFQV